MDTFEDTLLVREGEIMIYVGNDWADDHHDVAITDDSAKPLSQFQISHDSSASQTSRLRSVAWFDLPLMATRGQDKFKAETRSISIMIFTHFPIVSSFQNYSLKAVMGSRSNAPFLKRSMERELMSRVVAFPSTMSSAITFPTAGLC